MTPALPPEGSGYPAIACRGITKRFPGVLANDDVDFDALEGEVHALLGENGAGKSTLSNIFIPAVVRAGRRARRNAGGDAPRQGARIRRHGTP